MYYDIYEDDWFPEDPKDEVSSLMSSQYLQSSRQVVYSPSKQPNSQQVQQPATSMYTTTSGFQTFHFTPTYADSNGEQAKIEPHEGDGQVRVSLALNGYVASHLINVYPHTLSTCRWMPGIEVPGVLY